MKMTFSNPRTSESIPKLCLFCTHGGRGLDGNLFSLKDYNTPSSRFTIKTVCPPEPGETFGEHRPASSPFFPHGPPQITAAKQMVLPLPFSLSLPQSHSVLPTCTDTFTGHPCTPPQAPSKCKLWGPSFCLTAPISPSFSCRTLRTPSFDSYLPPTSPQTTHLPVMKR